MILHLLNRSPFEAESLIARLVATLAEGDALLLIEDGVNGALAPGVARLARTPAKLYALREDLDARGLSSRVAAGIEVIDVGGFVELSAKCAKTISWY
ncbi:sulfurtransferase complex subunit TusB [Halotalea alkalilenta]|uniref:sulfurtransferase complex subunit TusB n=1 Tax=Halotalea alkalilenta TaxID=376489 RepID=UPI000695025D|nr:sulfurtransferase complex subunit TusB [Halotalea alkalilenta]